MTPNGLWQAVLSRDGRADGLFVYAVQSTGIYCRPSCPSRRPRRERVEFFPAPAMAEARGYRACRRCRPDVPRPSAPPLDRVRRACDALARHPDAHWTSARLARAGGVSVVQLQRAFRGVLGLAPREYLAACRHRRFLEALRNGTRVTDAVYDAGFGSPSRVYGAFRLPGMTPATYGRGGVGAAIHWATGPSPIGQILVGATDRGLCFVEVGRTEDELQASLRREFPRAEIDAAASAGLASMLRAARAVAAAHSTPVELPVDIRGTAFQWRVWRALTTIPAGQTRTYSEVAREISRPSAVRAVARACATNPLTLVVPCHRVVRKDGGLGGYRWGINVKRALLEAERTSGVVSR